jgi:transcriptional regulator with XRE-family HTH domain
MVNILKLHKTKNAKNPSKQPRRPHYVSEWAALRGWNQAELAKRAGVDPSQVSRWLDGASPGTDAQEKLAKALDIDPADIFHHPDDVWFRLFTKGRNPDEVAHIKKSIETIFPRIGQK